MEPTQNNAEALLRLEEPFSPKDVKWLVAATSRDGRKGRVTPYADPRAYTDRLNEVVTASGWTRQYAVHTISPVFRLKKDKTIQTGKVLVTSTVTIAGIGSHSGSGEEWAPLDDQFQGVTRGRRHKYAGASPAELTTRTYWPGEDALGKRLKGGRLDASVPQIYLSMYQTSPKELAIFLRGKLDPSAIPGQVHEMVQSVDPSLPVYGAQTLDDALSASLAERRFSLEMVASFAVTALLLAALGIYGVISYIVTERTHDIGIRLALGAQRENILLMVLRQGLSLAIAGTAVGLVGALIVSHLMADLLYGVAPTDPLTFVAVTLMLTAVALAACYIPARRAMRVDPLVALRYE